MNQRRNTTNKTNLPQGNGNQDGKTSGSFGFRNNNSAPVHRLILEEDPKVYYGEIKGCKEAVSKNGNDMAVLEIAVDGEKLPFEIKCVYKNADKFVQFLYDLDEEFGREAKLEDLVGLRIDFSVSYNEKYPNFETLYLLDDETDEEYSEEQ